ncbi:unnamed protein product, partial [Ectocarpus sp. 12 AP-2014]
ALEKRPLPSSEKVADAGDTRPVLGVVTCDASLGGGSLSLQLPPPAQLPAGLLLPDDGSTCCCRGCAELEVGVAGRSALAGGAGAPCADRGIDDNAEKDRDDKEDKEAEEGEVAVTPTPPLLGISIAEATSSATPKIAAAFAGTPPPFSVRDVELGTEHPTTPFSCTRPCVCSASCFFFCSSFSCSNFSCSSFSFCCCCCCC